MADPPVIDVEALVEDLRGRVARARAEGGYADDLSGERLVAPPPVARVRFRPELAYSTKPLIGRPLTAVKKVLMRLTVHPFDDLARQADSEITAVDAAAQAAIEAEADVRERVQADVARLLSRIEGLEIALDRLQLPVRLARLERDRREAAPAAGSSAAAPAPAAASDGGVDYLAFEARFRGSEETVRERQEVYRPELAGRRRVVDLGCGRGELLEMLRDAGVGAYGVDTEPDFVDLVAEKGLEIRREDAVAHVRASRPARSTASWRATSSSTCPRPWWRASWERRPPRWRRAGC